MRRFVIGFFAIIGAGVTAIIVLAVVGRIIASLSVAPVASNTVLSLDLTAALPEAPSTDILARTLGAETPTMRDVLDALERGGNDSKVKGLFARLGDDNIGTAQAQELRDALAAFRAKGKFAIAYADTFGEFNSGTHAYYLAAAFDQIWLQPQGSLGLTGLASSTPFFRGTLDKLSIEPSFDHRSEFKTAMNEITEQHMTAPHREEADSLLRSVFAQIVHGIAADRHLSEADVRALIDRGPFLTQEAVDAHLVDRIGYRDQAEAEAKQRAGSGARLLSLANYLDRVGHPHRSGPTIALIYGTGLIQRGGSGGALAAGGFMGADTMTRAFNQASRDSAVKAILFRIDSPGGSAIASETIWQAVQRARGRGKPVIVSMGNVAGSGGYYVAAPADLIVAEPATLTGSIGVLAGKFVTTGFWDKLGVTWDSVDVGANADMFSTLRDFSPAEHQRFEAFLDATYQGFKDHVAAGRRLDPVKVEEVAKGRVWTGEQAQQRGLVDVLGGFDTALALAKKAAQVPADQDVTLKRFPPPESAAELLVRLLGGKSGDNGDDDTSSLAALRAGLSRLRLVVQQAELAALPPGSLAMPPGPLP